MVVSIRPSKNIRGYSTTEVWQGTRFMAWMYILKCVDGSYYVGSTKNLERRLSQHQEGVGAKYTSRRLPVELVYSEEFDRVVDAFNREKQVQNWSRAKREALINGKTDLLPALAKKKFEKIVNPPLVE
jgi:putative endonuclease